MRRIIYLGIGIALLVVATPVLVLGGGVFLAFWGTSSPEAGATLAEGRVTLLRDGYVNAFAIDAGDGVVLIDAGNTPEGITEALGAASIAPDEVRAIFLTHGHPDHTGGLAGFPGVPVYAATEEVPLIMGQVASDSPVGRVMGPGRPASAPPTPLRDGELVKVGDLVVQGFLVPGHTRGSMAYRAAGVLFLGDSAAARADGSVRGAPWVFSEDQDENLASLSVLAERIDGLGLTALTFGHTGSVSGTAALLALGREVRD